MKSQSIIIVLCVFSLGVGIWKMLQITTMMLPSWFLVLFYLTITFCVSFALGFLVKKILNSRWHTLTFSALFIIIICSIFYIIQYRSTYKIFIPDDYVGEVKLFVSNQKENDFAINKHGIGYIDRQTFDNGFYPKIFKGGKDITGQVKEYAKGSLATTSTDRYSFEYLSFEISNKPENSDKNIEELIKIGAIDTMRLYKRDIP